MSGLHRRLEALNRKEFSDQRICRVVDAITKSGLDKAGGSFAAQVLEYAQTLNA